MVYKNIFIAACMLFSFPVMAQVTNQHLFDTIPFIPEHTPQRIALFEAEPIVTGRIIFLGNSITEGGNWKQLLNDSTVINRGIGGDITFGILKRLDDVIKRQPSKLFILIGINDIGRDIPDTVIVDNYRKIIGRVQNESPSTKIYVQSILPLNPTLPNFPQHYDKQEHVINVNKMLKNLTRETQTTFVNIYPLFLDANDRMNKNYTAEGLHLNQEGYKVWVKFLKEKKYL